MTNLKNELIITAADGDLLTTSLAVALGTDTDHASVIKLMRTYLNDMTEFGLVRFEIQPRLVGQHGGGDVEYAMLNEPQATLLLTFMRNSEIVRTFKKRLVKEFWTMRQKGKFDPASLTRSDILRLALESEEARIQAVFERDKAIASKAEIGSRREATAMATASTAVRQAERLKIQLGLEYSHATVRAVEKALGQKFDWKPLSAWAKVNQPEKRYAVDPLFGQVRTWPAGAWAAVFGINVAEVLGGSQ